MERERRSTARQTNKQGHNLQGRFLLQIQNGNLLENSWEMKNQTNVK